MATVNEWLDLKEKEDKLRKQADTLKAERDKLTGQLKGVLAEGSKHLYKNKTYVWGKVTRAVTKWKGCYEKAYELLDDEGQVILGEFKDTQTNESTYYTLTDEAKSKAKKS